MGELCCGGVGGSPPSWCLKVVSAASLLPFSTPRTQSRKAAERREHDFHQGGGPGLKYQQEVSGCLQAGTLWGLLPQVPPHGHSLLQEAFSEVLLSPHPASPCPIRFLPLLPWPLPFLGCGPGPWAPRHSEGKRKTASFLLVDSLLGRWEYLPNDTVIPRTCCSGAGFGVGEGADGLDSTHHILCPHLQRYSVTPRPLPTLPPSFSSRVLSKGPLVLLFALLYWRNWYHERLSDIRRMYLILSCYCPQFTHVEN